MANSTVGLMVSGAAKRLIQAIDPFVMTACLRARLKDTAARLPCISHHVAAIGCCSGSHEVYEMAFGILQCLAAVTV
jgi:hypothetical protein